VSGVTRIEGRAYSLGRANIDTDMIIAADHLKTVTREGLGRHAFATLRGEGSVFDDPALAGAPILIAGANFGCGSSREHAVWALLDMGVRAVVAPSFSDIFASNAFKNGLVTAAIDPDAVATLLAGAITLPVAVDLATMQVTRGNAAFNFALDPFRRQCLIEGTDEIGLTLRQADAIAAHEARAPMLGWAIGAVAAGHR